MLTNISACTLDVIMNPSYLVFMDPNFLANFPHPKSLNLRLMLSCVALIWSINLELYLELKNKKHYLCNRKRGKRLLRIN